MTNACRWCGGQLQNQKVNPDDGIGCLAILLSVLIAMMGGGIDVISGSAGGGTLIGGLLALLGFIAGFAYLLGINTYKVVECKNCGVRQ